MTNDKKLDILIKRRDEILQLIQKYEAELSEIDRQIGHFELDGGAQTNYDSNAYEDTNPDYIRGTEDGI